jgi:hypothetical protein
MLDIEGRLMVVLAFPLTHTWSQHLGLHHFESYRCVICPISQFYIKRTECCNQRDNSVVLLDLIFVAGCTELFDM